MCCLLKSRCSQYATLTFRGIVPLPIPLTFRTTNTHGTEAQPVESAASFYPQTVVVNSGKDAAADALGIARPTFASDSEKSSLTDATPSQPKQTTANRPSPELTYEEHQQIMASLPPSHRRHALEPVVLPAVHSDDVDASWASKQAELPEKQQLNHREQWRRLTPWTAAAAAKVNDKRKTAEDSDTTADEPTHVEFRSVLGSVRKSRRLNPYHQRLPLHQAVLRSDAKANAASGG